MEEQARLAPKLVRRALTFSRLPSDTSHLDAEWLQSYNEIILESESWVANLPHTLEAVFVLLGSDRAFQQRARKVHASLISEYNLSVDELPLLAYDPQAKEPFFHYAAES